MTLVRDVFDFAAGVLNHWVVRRNEISGMRSYGHEGESYEIAHVFRVFTSPYDTFVGHKWTFAGPISATWHST
jgi:hypothetical protein